MERGAGGLAGWQPRGCSCGPPGASNTPGRPVWNRWNRWSHWCRDHTDTRELLAGHVVVPD